MLLPPVDHRQERYAPFLPLATAPKSFNMYGSIGTDVHVDRDRVGPIFNASCWSSRAPWRWDRGRLVEAGKVDYEAYVRRRNGGHMERLLVHDHPVAPPSRCGHGLLHVTRPAIGPMVMPWSTGDHRPSRSVIIRSGGCPFPTFPVHRASMSARISLF